MLGYITRRASEKQASLAPSFSVYRELIQRRTTNICSVSGVNAVSYLCDLNDSSLLDGSGQFRRGICHLLSETTVARDYDVIYLGIPKMTFITEPILRYAALTSYIKVFFFINVGIDQLPNMFSTMQNEMK